MAAAGGIDRREVRFILELEPRAHGDGAWGEEQGKRESKETSRIFHEEPGTASLLISRARALSG